MSERKDEKWLDERLLRAVGSSTPAFDAQAWKRKYADEYAALVARSKQVVGWGLPHHNQQSAESRWGKPGPQTRRNAFGSPIHPTLRIPRGPFGRIALAAAVTITAGVLLLGRHGAAPVQPVPGSRPVVRQSPAQMVSMISLSAAFESGGMEGLDKQCDRALERLGPRPNSVSMQELFKDLNGKG